MSQRLHHRVMKQQVYQNTLLGAARAQMTTRIANSDGAASGKIIFEINGDRRKKQEFNFRG